ncbi:ribonuclease [Clostridium sp. DMHC 10]|nr:ribonuclease E/G [Clostridium guangxiense]KOF56725.1 ribonuclease [Clostridium sp. DMHC 10]
MKQIYVERCSKILRIAIKKDGVLEQCFVEEDNDICSGQIYKGIVKNIVPAIKCAFVDIGESKSAYLYMDSKLNNLNLKKGEELLVEVIKEAAGSKGPKVSNAITVPGRYAVIITSHNEIEISKKITGEEYINKLKHSVLKPEDVGVMIRTNALKVDFETINIEIKKLYEIYKNVIAKSENSNHKGLMYNAGGAIAKVLRDRVDEDTVEIVVSNKDDFDYIKEYVDSKKDINCKVTLHDNIINLMDYYGIEKEILELTNEEVKLECGGFIVIDKTEAMYAIDVNSGKNVKSRDIMRTAIVTNLEAAKEIVRQIKLRNLSGIIVVDFIDINDNSVKRKILNVLEEGFKNDKSKTVIYPFTELNLVQIARSRKGKSICEYIEEKCELCNGNGKQLSLIYMKNLIANKIARCLNEHSGEKNIYIEMDKRYREKILCDAKAFATDVGLEDGNIYVNFKDNMRLFKIELVVFKDKIKEISQFKIYG